MKIVSSISAIALSIAMLEPCIAFVNPTSRRLHAPKSTLLRDADEIAAAEEKFVEPPVESSSTTATATIDPPVSSSSSTSTTKVTNERIKKSIKERPYPLFLAEKTASFLFDADPTKSLPSLTNEPKEKVVVLGTGWGAAAFLKNIDTNKFDVTVISPRNYFVFTPMLAGSAVGTVDFKSITKPIREVSYMQLLLSCAYPYAA